MQNTFNKKYNDKLIVRIKTKQRKLSEFKN